MVDYILKLHSEVVNYILALHAGVVDFKGKDDWDVNTTRCPHKEKLAAHWIILHAVPRCLRIS